MTTIIVVVVVALVFFVAVCVVAFMVWKRESEMRTDSIRAIEENLERLTHDLSGDSPPGDDISFTAQRTDGGETSYMDAVIAESMPVKPRRKRSYDPFGWVREDENRVRSDKENEALDELMEKPEAPEENIGNKDSSGEMVTDVIDDAGQAGSNELPKPPEPDVSEMSGSEDDIGGREDDIEDTMPSVEEPEETPDSISDNIADIRKLIAAYGDEDRDKAYSHEPDESSDNVQIEEISLDFMDEMDYEAGVTDTEEKALHRQQMGYDVGRSGKKYTASELETLIKE